MAMSTITSKGQVTIPVRVRAALGVDAGDRIEFVEMEKGQFAIIAATTSVQKLKGLIPKPRVPVSLERMNAAIIRQASRGSKSR
jgi:antitoxin PrlF